MSHAVGLVMIVKNEEAVIERALQSAKPFISTYVIIDTGSTDRTKEIISTVMADISGQIIDRPWVSFGHNRTEALALCDGQMDWAIMMDADDSLAGTVPPASVWAASKSIDAFIMRLVHGAIEHQRTQVFRTGIGWAYEGLVHEHPVCKSKPKPVIAGLPAETYMITRCEGARSKDPNKYLKDAQLLETALLENPMDQRTVFYLAQSYRDAGQLAQARHYYQSYLDIPNHESESKSETNQKSGGGDQERYMTYVNLIILSDDEDERLRLTWAAIDICPERLEAPYSCIQQRRKRGFPLNQQCFAVASFVKNRKASTHHMFAAPHIYEWGMDDELAITAFATKHYRECYDASMRCAALAPDEAMRAAALKNAKAAFTHLG